MIDNTYQFLVLKPYKLKLALYLDQLLRSFQNGPACVFALMIS